MYKKLISFVVVLSLSLSFFTFTGVKQVKALEASDFYFNGQMSQKVMDNYLSKATTILGFAYLCSFPDQKAEWLRFIRNTGTKMISRAVYMWDDYSYIDPYLVIAQDVATDVHAQDPECILEGAVFETTSVTVNNISIPDWVFTEFNLPLESRCFNYSAMLFSNGRYVNHWGTGCSVPDITRLESQMFYYYVARRFIDCGYEAIHFGQTKLTGEIDPYYCNWNIVMNRVRNYAKAYARRGNVLIDSHQTDLYDNCDSLWYSAKDQGKFGYSTSNSQSYFNGDNSRLTQVNGTQAADGTYIIYNLDNMTSYNILTANSNQYGEIPNAYDISTSTDGKNWSVSNYNSTEVYRYNNSLPNFRMTNNGALPTGTKYIKISWKVQPEMGLVQLMNVRIDSATTFIEDTLDQPNPTVKKLGLDYITYPLRLKSVSGMPQNAIIEPDYFDSIYKRAIGGINPQGFICERSPYLVEFDNFGGNNGNPGVDAPNSGWLWGYDEITWFALQSDSYRRSLLNYMVDWLIVNDPNGHLAMPGDRGYLRSDGTWDIYNAITPSTVYPNSFNDEETIKSIFARTGQPISDSMINGNFDNGSTFFQDSNTNGGFENGTSLLPNGGFENGSTGWYLDSNYGVSTTAKRSGESSLRLNGTGSNTNAAINITVEPNTNYTVSLYAKCSTSASYFNIYNTNWTVSLIGGAHRFNASDNWVNYTASFNSGNNTSIPFVITDYYGSGYTNFYDDISIIKEGTATGWYLDSNFSVSTAVQKSGTSSLKLIGSGSNTNALNYIVVDPNTNYTVSLYAKCSAAASYFNIYNVDMSASLIGGLHRFNASDGWVNYTASFNSGNNTMILYAITDYFGSGYINYYDDISIQKISTATAWFNDINFSICTAEKRSGENSLKLIGTGNNNNAINFFYVEPNTDYTVSLYAKCSATASYFNIYNSDWSTSLIGGAHNFNASSGWVHYTANFNSGNNTLIPFAITDYNGSGYVNYYDDISIVKSNNKVINDSFENGNMPWMLGAHFSVNTTDKKSGLFALKVVGTGDNCKSFQKICVEPNTNYTLTFYGKCNATSNYAIYNGDWSATIFENQVSSNNTWTKYTQTFNSGNNTSIILAITDNYSSNYTSYYDDFKLY